MPQQPGFSFAEYARVSPGDVRTFTGRSLSYLLYGAPDRVRKQTGGLLPTSPAQ